MKISLKNQIWLLYFFTSVVVLLCVSYSVLVFYHYKWGEYEKQKMEIAYREFAQRDQRSFFLEIQKSTFYIAVPEQNIFSPLAEHFKGQTISFPFAEIGGRHFFFQKFQSDHFGEIILGEDVSLYHESEERIIAVFFQIGAILLLLIGAIGFFFSRLAVRPLRRFRDEIIGLNIHHLSSYSSDLQFLSSDELGQLHASFQSMIHKIHQHQKQEKEFIALTSHELKTPLTSLITSLELSKTYPEKLSEALQDAHFLSELLQQLFFLSKIENTHIEIKSINVSVLLEKEIQKYKEELQLLKRRLQVDIVSNVVAESHPEIMTRILQNLLENALKFTPESGSITVKLHPSSLLISNTCFEKIDSEKVSEAFYQGEISKSGQGSGIGLYFVKKCTILFGFLLKIKKKNDIFSVEIFFEK